MIYALFLCGAGAKRQRGYSGNFKNLRVSDEQHLRLAYMDTCDADGSRLEQHQKSLQELMVHQHVALAEHVVGLAFIRLTASYETRLDNLSHEQRIVFLVMFYRLFWFYCYFGLWFTGQDCFAG